MDLSGPSIDVKLKERKKERSASHDQGLWVLDLFPFSWRSALCGGFFIWEDLGPSILYFFSFPWLGAKFY